VVGLRLKLIEDVARSLQANSGRIVETGHWLPTTYQVTSGRDPFSRIECCGLHGTCQPDIFKQAIYDRVRDDYPITPAIRDGIRGRHYLRKAT